MLTQIADVPRDADGRRHLGRRPFYVKWAPSKPLPWWFGAWSEGRRFTTEQEEALISAGRDPVTNASMEVRREYDPYTDDRGELRISELWPFYAFECPVIGLGQGGTVRVIGPNGKPRDVRPDGWAKKPHKNPYYGM